MLNKILNQLLGLTIAGILFFSNLQPATAQSASGTGSGGNPVRDDGQVVLPSNILRPDPKTPLDANQSVRVIVQLSDPASASYLGGIQTFRATSLQANSGKTLNVTDPNVVSYETYLRGRQAEFSTSLQAAVPQARTERAFQTVLNAVVVRLPAGQVNSLANLPGVVKISYEQERTLEMDASVPLIGLGTGTLGGAWTNSGLWQTLGGHANAGKGIKIADIDSGITPSNPCFSPAGFSMPSGYPRGEAAITNAKIIVARSYFRVDDLPFYPSSALDDPASVGGGHGTHTAGTMVCDYGTGVPNSGIRLSGVAPAAQLMVYRVFYYSISGSHSAYTPELIAAVEDAVRDGAQVVNNSWGGANLNTVDDLETIAYQGAVDAGVVVVFSAGNNGPASSSMAAPGGNSEKFITVAASSTGRSFSTTLQNTARSDGGSPFASAITGTSVSGTTVTAPIVDLEGSGYADPQACAALPSGYAAGKIVLISRGNCSLLDEVANVKSGGALGAVIRNVSGGATDLPVTFPVLPSIQISQANGDALAAYLTGLPGGVSATFRINSAGPVTASTPDAVPYFSSRGPNPDLTLKPDISAPGVNILSSVSASEYGSAITSFDFYNGTSMAAPHVSGAAALMKQVHSDWTPAQIRSALMSTAAEPASLGADPTVRGSGRLDLTQPDKVELTFDHPSLSFQLALVGVPKTLAVSAKNTTAQNVTYTIGVTANANAALAVKVDGAVAASLTVPANSAKTFSVELTGVSVGSAIGKISLTSPASGKVLHLPYYARVTANDTDARVYLVDGDSSSFSSCNDYAPLYKAALDDSGISYTYVELGRFGSGLDFFQARRFDWVLYFDGDPGCGSWLELYPSALANFMAQGGRMLLMGQDAAYWDYYTYTNRGYSIYPSVYFGASYVQDNLLYGAALLTAGDADYSPFVGGMVLPLNPSNTKSVDELAPSFFNDADMLPLFANKSAPVAIGGSYKGAMGVRTSSEPTIERIKGTAPWTRLPYRTLITSFGLENILEGSGTTYRQTFLTKMDVWLMDTPSVAFTRAVFQTPQPNIAVALSGLGQSSRDGDILYYRVDFGDGSAVEIIPSSPSGALAVNHKYSNLGTYTVYVEMADIYGHKAVNTATVNVGYLYHLPVIAK